MHQKFKDRNFSVIGIHTAGEESGIAQQSYLLVTEDDFAKGGGGESYCGGSGGQFLSSIDFRSAFAIGLKNGKKRPDSYNS